MIKKFLAGCTLGLGFLMLAASLAFVATRKQGQPIANPFTDNLVPYQVQLWVGTGGLILGMVLMLLGLTSLGKPVEKKSESEALL